MQTNYSIVTLSLAQGHGNIVQRKLLSHMLFIKSDVNNRFWLRINNVGWKLGI